MIRVHSHDGEIFDYDGATAWHVDEKGLLHLLNADGRPVASFAAFYWAGVAKVEADG